MAEGGGTERAALDKLKGELTCPVCLGVYKDPRQLPCQHVLCAVSCLSDLLKKASNDSFICPECRTQIQGTNVDNFPKAFKMNSLKEVYQDLLDKEKSSTCKKHPSQELAMYCESCDQLTCRDCYLKSDEHKWHDKGFIEAVAPAHRAELISKLEEADKVEELMKALEDMQLILDQIGQRQKEIVSKIEGGFEVLIDLLQKEKESLLATVHSEMTAREETLCKDKDELMKSIREISDIVRAGKTVCATSSNTEFLMRKKGMNSRLTEAINTMNQLQITPSASSNIDVHMLDRETLQATCQGHTSVFTPLDPTQCTP